MNVKMKQGFFSVRSRIFFNGRAGLLPAFLPLLLLLSACGSLFTSAEAPGPNNEFIAKEEDRLTQQERDEIVFHARNFVTGARRLRLSEQEKRMILQEKPMIWEWYYASKYGKMQLEWILNNRRTLQLTCEGSLLAEKPKWRLQIINQTEERGTIASGLK